MHFGTVRQLVFSAVEEEYLLFDFMPGEFLKSRRFDFSTDRSGDSAAISSLIPSASVLLLCSCCADFDFLWKEEFLSCELFCYVLGFIINLPN